MATQAPNRRSQGKEILYSTLLFNCSAHFEAKIATGAAGPQLHLKRALYNKLLLTCLGSWKQTWRLVRLLEDYMANEHSLLHNCSPVFLTLHETMRLVKLIVCYMGKQHSQRDFVSPLFPTWKQTFPLGQFVEGHIAKVLSAAYFDSAVLLSSKKTL